MPIDTSSLAFPKPEKRSKSKKNKKTKEPDIILFEAQVEQMTEFYETHRSDMASIENYRYTKKLREQLSHWIRDVMISQKCDDVNDVMAAWEQTVIYAAEKVHPSHKVGSFINMFWLTKNDSNYLDVLEGKYDKEFRKPKPPTSGWGDPKDFGGIQDSGPSGVNV